MHHRIGAAFLSSLQWERELRITLFPTWTSSTNGKHGGQEVTSLSFRLRPPFELDRGHAVSVSSWKRVLVLWGMKDRIQVAVGLGWAHSLASVAGFASLTLCSESSSEWSQGGMRLGMTGEKGGGGREGDEDGVVGFACWAF